MTANLGSRRSHLRPDQRWPDANQWRRGDIINQLYQYFRTIRTLVCIGAAMEERQASEWLPEYFTIDPTDRKTRLSRAVFYQNRGDRAALAGSWGECPPTKRRAERIGRFPSI